MNLQPFSHTHYINRWWCGIVGSMLVLNNEVTPHWAQLVLGWVTVYSRYTTLVSLAKTGQLSLLSSVRRKMSTGQRVVMLCSLGVKAVYLTVLVDKCVGGR